jgi:hypothetical protein
MSRRRTADYYLWDRSVLVRCHRCRRVIGRLSLGWFQPKRPVAGVPDQLPQVFTFPGQPKPLFNGRPMRGITAIQLDGWSLAGVPCGCRKRDGTQMTCTLNLHKMYHATQIDELRHDLIAGVADFGLVGIHDELDYIMRLDMAPGAITDAEAKERGPSTASGEALMRRIHNRSRRKTWRVGYPEDAKQTVTSATHLDTDDPVDRA